MEDKGLLLPLDERAKEIAIRSADASIKYGRFCKNRAGSCTHIYYYYVVPLLCMWTIYYKFLGFFSHSENELFGIAF